MSKSCDECKNDEKTALEEPCSRCYRYEQFEQKEETTPQPSKTLLDEFAMAAPARVFEEGHHGMASFASSAYQYAAAMMAERARRDEMGNVKEVK